MNSIGDTSRILNQVKPQYAGCDNDNRVGIQPLAKDQFTKIIVLRNQNAPLLHGSPKDISVRGGWRRFANRDHVFKKLA